MTPVRIDLGGRDAGFDAALAIARAVAGELLHEPMLLSWYDAVRGLESPAGVSECSAAEPTAGVLAYARHRGGALTVEFAGDGRLFCFADVGAD